MVFVHILPSHCNSNVLINLALDTFNYLIIIFFDSNLKE